MAARPRRLARFGCLLLLVLAPARLQAQTVLPDVEVTLGMDVRDTATWVALHEETLRTPREIPKPVMVTIPTIGSVSRSITIDQPVFTVDLRASGARRFARLGISGRIPGPEAIRTLTNFEQALLDIQADAISNQVTLHYGVAVVTGQLLDFRVTRP